MTSKNIFAYTAPTGIGYPEYLSINERDGEITVTVRGPIRDDRSCGETVDMTLPHDEMRTLYHKLRTKFQGA